MRPSPLVRFLGGLLCAATLSASAHADAGSTAGGVTEVPAAPAALSAARAVLASRGGDGVYELSSGQSMDLRSAGGAVRMRYGQRRALVLRHDGRGNFVSADGRVALQFELAADGRPRAARLQVAADWL